MPNGARHTLGAVAGLISTPVIAAALMFSTERFTRAFQTFLLHESGQWPAGAAVLVAGILMGVLVGSRISPLASLVPGVVFTAVGLLWLVAPRFALRHTVRVLPAELDRGYTVVGPYGVALVVGVLLLVASLFPSRWAARAPRPAGVPPQQFGGPPAPPYGQGPQSNQPPLPHRQPGQSGHSGRPGQPPAPYQPGEGPPPPAYAPRPGPERRPAEDRPADSGEGGGDPGGWTQMYGTGRSGQDDESPGPR
jgi:hypothetical protein